MRNFIGQDANEKLKIVPNLFDFATGQMISIPLYEAFAQGLQDTFVVSNRPLYILFPSLMRHGLTRDVRRLHRNH